MTHLRTIVIESVALLGSLGTLLCCAVPAALVSVGAEAAMVSLVTNVPQLVWLSEHKAPLFIVTAIMLVVSSVATYSNRNAPVQPIRRRQSPVYRLRRWSVEDFKNRTRWDHLTSADLLVLRNEVAGLPTEVQQENPAAKFFDLLICKLQLAILRKDPTAPGLILRVREIASRLEEMERIPVIAREMQLIQEVQSESFWAGVTLPMLEECPEKAAESRASGQLLPSQRPRDRRRFALVDHLSNLPASQ